MKFNLNNTLYDVVIERKNNKNTYVSIDDNLVIRVKTNYFTSNNKVLKILNDNYDFLLKNMSKRVKQKEKKGEFYYLGNRYDIIFVPTIKNIEFDGNKIYVKDKKHLLKWYKDEMTSVFTTRLDYCHKLFKENIPYPNLRIRSMKTRWGVCNRKTVTITLNAELIRESIDKIDYVIVHELSHFIHPNHSKNFWGCVSQYIPDYKQIRKQLRD